MQRQKGGGGGAESSGDYEDWDDEDEADDGGYGFVVALIRGGKVGYDQDHCETKDPNAAAPAANMSYDEPTPSETVRAARALYFRERSAIFSAVLDLEATDPLLKLGLVTNLVKTVRELTAKYSAAAQPSTPPSPRWRRAPCCVPQPTANCRR